MHKWEIKSEMFSAKHGLVHKNEKRPNLVLQRGKNTIWFWESLGLRCLWGMKPDFV